MFDLPRSKTRTRATISDVAQLAGVSTATVSRFINQTAPVARETAIVIEEAITKLGYVPSTAARSLASRKTNTLGLLLPDISSDFFPPMLRGIESAARNDGFGLLISTQKRSPATTGGGYVLGEHNTDGMLIFTDSLDARELNRLYKLAFPMVLLYQSPPAGTDTPYVAIENKSGAYKLMEHLIQVHQCRQIGFLRGPEGNEDSYWREMGYREALEAYGLPVDDARIGTGGFSEAGGRQAVQRWLELGMELDAIFAGDDTTASGVLAALREAGVEVPDRIAVVGFDDIPIARYFTPPLTTVRTPIERAGFEATKQLIQLIREGSTKKLVLLPTELTVRRSCGCR